MKLALGLIGIIVAAFAAMSCTHAATWNLWGYLFSLAMAFGITVVCTAGISWRNE